MKRALTVPAALAILVLGACGKSTPTETPTCVPFTGKYAGAFQDSCGGRSTGEVTLFQNGCAFVGQLPGVGTIQGTVNGAVATITVGFTACGGSASGTALLTTTGVSGTYSGQATGTGACCGAVSGSFTLTRE